MNRMKRLLPALLLSLPVAPDCRAQETGNIIFSHDEGQGVMSLFGTQKVENYDVAIQLPGETMKGLTVVGVVVPMHDGPVTNMSVWLSKELKVEVIDKKRVNVPDVSTQTVTPQSGWMEIPLDQPYTITDEGVHVGYSFEMSSLDNGNDYPIVVTTDNSPGGFFVRTSRTYRSWEDKSSLCSSCMLVLVSGAKGDAVALDPIADIDGGAGEPTTVTLPLVNHGFNGVKDFDYSYTVDGRTESGHVDLGEDSIAGRYQLKKNVDIQIAPIAKKGTYPLSITLTKVNGRENADSATTVETTLKIYGALPRHRAVMEEYTGGWCGFCPRGMVAMEMLNEQYPDDFIGLAYHNDDPMEITSDFPSEVSGFPMCYIDRASGDLDPFLGTGRQGVTLETAEIWAERCRVTAPADVELSATLSEDGNTVDVASSVTFPIPPKESGYKVEFVLVADSLTGSPNDGWYQANYFRGDQSYSEYEKMLPFIQGEQYLFGLYYNDVVVATSRLLGEDAALPAEISEDETVSLSYKFDLSKVLNVKGESLIQNKKNLRVVALLVAPDGTIANANKAKVLTDGTDTGIQMVQTDRKSAERFDLTGRRIPAPQKGLNILRGTDGRFMKVLVK